jgi:hypothetical protein
VDVKRETEGTHPGPSAESRSSRRNRLASIHHLFLPERRQMTFEELWYFFSPTSVPTHPIQDETDVLVECLLILDDNTCISAINWISFVAPRHLSRFCTRVAERSADVGT